MTLVDAGRAGRVAVAFVALVVLIQIVVAYPRIASEPLIDGRLHTDFDTAAFLLRAFHSNDGAIVDWRKVFGVATYLYDDENKPIALDLYANLVGTPSRGERAASEKSIRVPPPARRRTAADNYGRPGPAWGN